MRPDVGAVNVRAVRELKSASVMILTADSDILERIRQPLKERADLRPRPEIRFREKSYLTLTVNRRMKSSWRLFTTKTA